MTSMQTVRVELGPNSYEIRVGPGLLAQAGHWLKEMGFSDKAVIITDDIVRGLYGSALEAGLAAAGFDVTVLEVPAGERQKTLATAGRLYDGLNEFLAERATPILALGGGVTGDLAGFVAATFMRGIPYIQVPTTLLAMVDSSIGGKTAVDHGQLKNVVGAFYQPKLVVADIETLRSLPEAELSNGLAEVIKHAAIKDEYFFKFLENNIGKVKELDPEVLEKIVVESARIKAAVVAGDEKETGLRALLNYGHTVGHAVEVVSGFSLKHGQAVAIGMVAEAKIASRLGKLDGDAAARLERVIAAAGLPVKIPSLDKKKLMQAMGHDKKVKQGRLTFVLLQAIGEAFITRDVGPALVQEVVAGG
jgi:3-dehydroquinate synthase